MATTYLVFQVDEGQWDGLKQLAGGLDDKSLFIFLMSAGAGILNALAENSRILEYPQKGHIQEMDFASIRDSCMVNGLIERVSSRHD